MVMNYYRNIDRTKVQFDFMVHRQERGAYDDEIEALGGKIYRMPPVRPWTAKEYRAAVRKFYAGHPEYRIIHSHMSELGYYDFIEAEKAGVPVRICHAHNRPHGIDIKSPVRWFYKTMMRPHVSEFFMCGEESGLWLFGKGNQSKLVQMNNAIDAAQYSFDPMVRDSVRKDLGLSDDQIVIGHVGRFDVQKNHPFIIDIFNEVHAVNSQAILLLVGDDSNNSGMKIHEKVHRLGLDESVKFLGTRSDVAKIMQAMDVFLFPSLFEGFGIVALEAQAAGLPCIVSERIPPECMITKFIMQEKLTTSAVKWADKILKMKTMRRESTFAEICNAGFDIKENARWLQELYINTIR